MAKKKILEIGIEGGGAVFLADQNASEITIQTVSNDFIAGDNSQKEQTFDSFEEAIKSFTDKNRLLLFFYPVHIHPDFRTRLAKQLNKEFGSLTEEQKAECFNIEEWEKLLDTSIKGTQKSSAVQTFEISPLEKVQSYQYDHRNNEKELQKRVTSWIDVPNQKF